MENKQSNLAPVINGGGGKSNVGSNTMGTSPDSNLAAEVKGGGKSNVGPGAKAVSPDANLAPEVKGGGTGKMDVGPGPHKVSPDANLAGAAPKGGGSSNVGSNTMGTSPDSNLQNGIGANHKMTDKVFGQTPANLGEKKLSNIKGFERFINEDYKKK